MERVYPENQWVTPVELFKPYYGYTVANCILTQLENRRSRRLRVLEIGPGTGTMADSLLDFFRNYDLTLYRDCEYTLVEISPQLAAQCEQLLRQNHGELWESNQLRVFNGSFLDYQRRHHGPTTFVVALEVLDNLPHDRLYFSSDKARLTHQAAVKVVRDEDRETLADVREPLADPLCQLFAELHASMPAKDHVSATRALN